MITRGGLIMKIIAHYPVSYRGSLLWLFFWLIAFFPAGTLLFASRACIKRRESYYGLNYRGSIGWLIFWTIVFFPVAVVLAFLRGVDMVEYCELEGVVGA